MVLVLPRIVGETEKQASHFPGAQRKKRLTQGRKTLCLLLEIRRCTKVVIIVHDDRSGWRLFQLRPESGSGAFAGAVGEVED
jgi:hypothetical protein